MTLISLTNQPASATQSVHGSGLPTAPAGGEAFYQPVDIHRALEQVRQMPEFEPPKPNWLDELWKRPEIRKLSHQVGDAIHQVLKSLFGWLEKMKPPGLSHLPDNIRDIFSGFVGFLLILAGLFALYVLLGWLLRLRERNEPILPPEARLLEQVLLVSAEHHYQQALAAAEGEDYEAALKQLYMATLCFLDERKIAPYEATRTNWEYLTLLERSRQPSNPGDADLKACFERMARQFEAVRYGMQPMSQGQFEKSRSDYQSMQTLAAGWLHE